MKNSFKQHCNIVGIGEILWDMLPEGKRLGGAPANFAIHSNALGAKAKIISAVGKDDEGDNVVDFLRKREISAEYLYRNNAPTGSVSVAIDKQGHPAYTIQQNVAWDFMETCLESEILAKTCDAVCFGSLAQRNSITRKSIHKFLSLTESHCLRVFDINLRQNFFSKEVIESSLLAANVLKLNEEELIVLTNLFSLPGPTQKSLQALIDTYDLHCIALTRGSGGSIMMDRENIVSSAGAQSTIKDTVGAGDSFAATMTMGLLHGFPLNKINLTAEKIAAYVCSQAGATPDLPPHLITDFRNHCKAGIRDIKKTSLTRKQMANFT